MLGTLHLLAQILESWLVTILKWNNRVLLLGLKPCMFPSKGQSAGQVLVYGQQSVRSRSVAEASWNVMAHAQEPDFFFRRNGRVHLNRRGRQFSRLLAAEVCASAVVMLDTPCSEVVWRLLATHCIRQFPLHFPSCASPCAITFQLESTQDEEQFLCGYKQRSRQCTAQGGRYVRRVRTAIRQLPDDGWYSQAKHVAVNNKGLIHRGADKSLARPGREKS